MAEQLTAEQEYEKMMNAWQQWDPSDYDLCLSTAFKAGYLAGIKRAKEVVNGTDDQEHLES